MTQGFFVLMLSTDEKLLFVLSGLISAFTYLCVLPCVWVYRNTVTAVTPGLVIWLWALAPSPEVDGSPVSQVEEDEHDREHAEEDQICSGEPVRAVYT